MLPLGNTIAVGSSVEQTRRSRLHLLLARRRRKTAFAAQLDRYAAGFSAMV